MICLLEVGVDWHKARLPLYSRAVELHKIELTELVEGLGNRSLDTAQVSAQGFPQVRLGAAPGRH